MTALRHLVIVLGDQLDLDAAAFDAFDLAPMPRAPTDPATRCRSFSAFCSAPAATPASQRC